MDIHKVIEISGLNRKSALFYQNHRFTGPYNPLHLQLDRKMLAELNALVPKGRCEKVDRQLVRNVIGLEHRMGRGIDGSNQLANDFRNQYRRRFGHVLYSLNKLMIYGLQI